jgi:choline dehydrogenase-like flavoprotein
VSKSVAGRVVEADLCVVGAGPAGISLVREMLGTGIEVVLLESGGYAFDADIQLLSDGEQDSSHHADGAVRGGRLRQFGGTANLWVYRTIPDNGRRQARSVPPEPIDFEARFGAPATGWPIGFEEMQPYYERAQAIWNRGPFDYRVARWTGGAAPIAGHGGRLATGISQHGPNDVFTLRYRDDLLAADNVRVMVGCTALRLASGPSGDRVEAVEVAGPSGEVFAVRAKSFVLAAGGIENAQILLLSAPGVPGAAGNRHDTVGRFLTDHPEFRMGTITPSDPAVVDTLGLYDLRWVDDIMVSGFLTLSEEIKRDEGLLNLSAALVLHMAGFGTDAHRALGSLAPTRRMHPSDLVRIARSVLGAPVDAARAAIEQRRRPYEEWSGGWSRPAIDRRRFPVIELHAAPEQVASRDNRVTLSDRRDRLGRQRPRVAWSWDRGDRQNATRSVELLAAALRDAGVGQLEPWGSLLGRDAPRFGGFHHPMGTTRMHPDPTAGVVDLECRVHGLENVYVAGSSVFPTGHGYANPTLTIIALAVRLGDHLKISQGEGA